MHIHTSSVKHRDTLSHASQIKRHASWKCASAMAMLSRSIRDVSRRWHVRITRRKTSPKVNLITHSVDPSPVMITRCVASVATRTRVSHRLRSGSLLRVMSGTSHKTILRFENGVVLKVITQDYNWLQSQLLTLHLIEHTVTLLEYTLFHSLF